LSPPQKRRFEPPWIHSPRSAFPEQFDEIFQFFARGPVPRKRPKEGREFAEQFFVFQHIIRDAAGIHGGVVEELEPVVGALFQAKLLRPGAKRFFVARWSEDFPFNLAPVAGVVARQNSRRPSRCRARSSLMNVPNIILW